MIDFLFCILEEFVKLPPEDEFELLENGFKQLEIFKHTILVIDETHTPINIHKINDEEYFSRKESYSINCCVSLNNKKRFRSVNSHLGSSHN